MALMVGLAVAELLVLPLGHLSLGLALLLHAGLSAGFAWSVQRWAPGNGARGWAVLAGLLAFSIPVLGAPGMALVLLTSRKARSPHLVEAFLASIKLPELPDEGDDRTVEERLEEHLSVEPLVDLMQQADTSTMRAIVEMLSQSHDRRMIRLLNQALQDPRMEVYQLALHKISHLQEQFALGIYEAQEKVKKHPDVVEFQVRLAQQYLDYYNSGLLDGALEDYYWKLTQDRFLLALKMDPGNQRLRLQYAELHLYKRDFQQASTAYRHILAQWPECDEARLRLLEIQFEEAATGSPADRQAFIDTLRFSRIKPEKLSDPALRQCAEWWMTLPQRTTLRKLNA
ncbi:MAG: tetratricopeptide repeat protein [Candidatus Xenobia bacterium]